MAKDFLNPANKKTRPTPGLSAILRSPRELAKEQEEEQIESNVPKSEPKKTEKKQPKVDRRKREDKKVTFTNSLRGTLLNEVHQTIKDYKKAIDVDYNLAKFLEDASQAQLKVLRNKMS